MPRISTAYFGELEYEPESVFQFPDGIPGFEDETAFLFVEQPRNHPLVFIQSLVRPTLCFLALPILAADPEYRLEMAPDDVARLQLAPDRQPVIGEEIACLALITVVEGSAPTANLASPIVVNLRTKVGLQAVQWGTGYAFRHPILNDSGADRCSY